MKNIFFLLTACALFFGFIFPIPQKSYGQSESEVVASIKIAIKAGSSKELSKFLNSPVEINFDDQKSSYSSSQAEFVLKDFFASHTPSSFEYIHQGASKEGLKYIIGKYVTGAGAFRVYMLIKEVQGKYVIDTLDFSKE